MSEESPCPPPTTGEFSWNELITSNTAASGGFYGKLFGWQVAPFPHPAPAAGLPPCQLFKTETNPMPVGGLMQAMQPGTPTQWLAYVVVDNADASLARAVELGATVIVPVMPVPQVGRIAVFRDPQGAALGLHELPKPGA
jgi:predicted enzyme related to lactoylglutathione lyase